ncbi:MAG: TIGR01212 family radical SAM protein [bacterium]
MGSGPEPVRYHAFSAYLRERFGGRIRRIPLDAGFGCPHRGGGPTGRQGSGCIYCANEAFSPGSGADPLPLEEQLARGIRLAQASRRRPRAAGFIAYFQAFSNTYGPVRVLKERYDVIRRFPEIRVLAVGTRPDCVDGAVLDLLGSYCADYEVWIEYGLQSASDKTLERIRRGHTVAAFVQAVEETARRPDLKICTHVILGLPGEGHEEMMGTARFLSGLPLHGVKIHHGHVVRGTPLADEYLKGAYRPLEYADYLGCVCDFLELIPWKLTIQRLVGEAPAALLLAPHWGRTKTQILGDIQGELARRGSRQGARFQALPAAPG